MYPFVSRWGSMFLRNRIYFVFLIYFSNYKDIFLDRLTLQKVFKLSDSKKKSLFLGLVCVSLECTALSKVYVFVAHQE